MQPLIDDATSFEQGRARAINAVINSVPGLCDGVNVRELTEMYLERPDKELAELISRCCKAGGDGLSFFVMKCFEEGDVDVVEKVVKKDPEAGKGLIKHARDDHMTDTLLSSVLMSRVELTAEEADSAVAHRLEGLDLFEVSKERAEVLQRLLHTAHSASARPLCELFASGLAKRAKLKPSPAQVKSEIRLLECAASCSSASVKASAFSRLSVLLPRALKKRGKAGEHDPERLTSLALEILPSSLATSDDNLVFSLLKYGLSRDTEYALDLLVPLLGDRKARILDLARNHSKFKEAMGRPRGLKMLLACLEGIEEVEDGVELLSAILSNHGGGLTATDSMMRKVMKIMSSKFNVAIPLSEIIKGGGAAFGAWGGFVSSVDTRRVLATLGR